MPVSIYKSGPPVARLRLQLMAGNRYAFTFGDALIRLHVSAVTLYGRKEEAFADARLCRLSIDDEGEVSISGAASRSRMGAGSNTSPQTCGVPCE